jgi:lipopolysaccharide transport system ATP-binding protein
MSTAISVHNLGKCYRVTRAATGGRHVYRTLRESLASSLMSPLRALRGGSGDADSFWALRDLSFEVPSGEVLGIIGHNGAGKSTLLKILSRITKPTTGRVEIRGRVGSLLEVGTGFHPELTGRENVYLNGSILGMTRAEIRAKFDAIVAFAEIEEFLDTPVKRYSSGMYVRLAFSVAAHLEPEILVVDEVLAVGDATYQRRCIDRMSRLASEGRTILLVSHNMDLIPRLCQRALLLESGRKVKEGRAGEVIRYYLDRQLAEASDSDDLREKVHTGDGRARFVRVQHADDRGRLMLTHGCGEDLILRLEIEARCDIPDVALAVVIKTLEGARIITSWTREAGFRVDLREGRQTYQCRIRNVRLRPGRRVNVHLWMATQNVIDCVEHARIIEVSDTEETRGLSTDAMHGVVVCEDEWSEVGHEHDAGWASPTVAGSSIES